MGPVFRGDPCPWSRDKPRGLSSMTNGDGGTAPAGPHAPLSSLRLEGGTKARAGSPVTPKAAITREESSNLRLQISLVLRRQEPPGAQHLAGDHTGSPSPPPPPPPPRGDSSAVPGAPRGPQHGHNPDRKEGTHFSAPSPHVPTSPVAAEGLPRCGKRRRGSERVFGALPLTRFPARRGGDPNWPAATALSSSCPSS